MEILQSLFILLILMGVGVLSRRLSIFQKSDVKVISSFVYHFSLPALFLAKISQIDFSQLDPVLLWGSVVPILLIWIVLIFAYILNAINRDTFILLSLSIVMGSNAFFGLAFFEFFQNGLHYNSSVIAASVLGAIGIFLSLLMFEFSQGNMSIGKIFRNLRKNPLLISIFVGLFFSIIGFRESFLHSAFEMLGNASGSIAVFSLGIFLYDSFSLDKAKLAMFYSLFRFISLAVGVVLSLLFLKVFYSEGFLFDMQQFLLLQAAIPAAVSLVIFAERYQYKVSEITGIVILTSVLSFVFILLNYVLSFVIF
ncbi:MAG: AEC family transporter [Candidatus Margulisbacteria bacterium]|nr:AEC family transporter [Candidatus Margulisiibacteriota bacterium]